MHSCYKEQEQSDIKLSGEMFYTLTDVTEFTDMQTFFSQRSRIVIVDVFHSIYIRHNENKELVVFYIHKVLSQ